MSGPHFLRFIASRFNRNAIRYCQLAELSENLRVLRRETFSVKIRDLLVRQNNFLRQVLKRLDLPGLGP